MTSSPFEPADPPDHSGMRKGLTSYGDQGFSLFLRKAFIKGAGFTDAALDRPVVGIANTGSAYNPCHGNAPQLIEAVKRGVMLYQGAVEQHHWLDGTQMIDGLALGETTPGPLIMVVAFVGFVGGWLQQVAGPGAWFAGGALAATVVTFFTFLPSFVFILAGGPLTAQPHLHAEDRTR